MREAEQAAKNAAKAAEKAAEKPVVYKHGFWRRQYNKLVTKLYNNLKE